MWKGKETMRKLVNILNDFWNTQLPASRKLDKIEDELKELFTDVVGYDEPTDDPITELGNSARNDLRRELRDRIHDL
jgi:hypothetical protein